MIERRLQDSLLREFKIDSKGQNIEKIEDYFLLPGFKGNNIDKVFQDAFTPPDDLAPKVCVVLHIWTAHIWTTHMDCPYMDLLTELLPTCRHQSHQVFIITCTALFTMLLESLPWRYPLEHRGTLCR